MAAGSDKSFKDKHGPDTTVDETIKNALLSHVREGELPCAVAFKIAGDLGVSPRDVGITLDLLNLRLTKCQMGLFGYTPNKKIVSPLSDIPSGLEAKITASLADRRLACSSAWEIAESEGAGKMTVSNACEALGVKIKPCQLGAF
jgi:hypothetical protein